MSSIWKAIPGYEGYYEVNEYGEVKSLERPIKAVTFRGTEDRIKKERILDGFMDCNGLMGVILSIGKYKKRIYRQVLVAKCFLEGPRDQCVIHLDGNKINNHYTNLKWGTRTENILHLNSIKASNWHLHVVSLKTGIQYPSVAAACRAEDICYEGAISGIKGKRSNYLKLLKLV